VLHQRSIKITYQAMEAKEAKERMIDPYHIANLAGEWYVFARCHRSEQLIQFAIPRIRRAAMQKGAFTIPDDFDMQELLSKTFGRFAVPYGKVHTVRLVFDKEIAPWVLERQWHRRQKIRKRKNGNIELSFEAAGLFEVFRWVLAWGHHCRVLAPTELKKRIADEVRLMGQQRKR
jgi:predicted DNA-binding transcriptional regulator YafY